MVPPGKFGRLSQFKIGLGLLIFVVLMVLGWRGANDSRQQFKLDSISRLRDGLQLELDKQQNAGPAVAGAVQGTIPNLPGSSPGVSEIVNQLRIELGLLESAYPRKKLSRLQDLEL